MEWELAHRLLAGYRKGGEKASVPITFDVTCKLGTASEYYFPGHAILLLSHIPSKIHQQWIGLHCAFISVITWASSDFKFSGIIVQRL